jgi:hypothetical protein
MEQAMISLILPYWRRQAAADRALELLGKQYVTLDLEVIVVDDGNPELYDYSYGLPFRAAVRRLAEKHEPKNSCVPFNRGAELATGEYIALSSIEMLHTMPVLAAMRDEIIRGGDKTYVMAAVWNPEQNRWHAHSSLTKWREVEDIPMPPGAQWHFMSMMHRSLWDAAGGFDEEYRDGAGYDDPDLVLRLARAGARFVMRDDLVIEHPREGARSAWTPAMFERNKQLFIKKWGGVRKAA